MGMIPLRAWFAATGLLAWVGSVGGAPTLHDERLSVTLIAEAPDIRNPIGIAVGRDDRIYVVESHTSLRPSDYEGPETDRIRMIIDRDGDGQPERIATAMEGLHEAMGLAVSPDDGGVYLACASEVVCLLDKNDDGIFDGKRVILTLESASRHPHYRLGALAFSEDGWLYLSLGNNEGYGYTLRGSDGSLVSGFGEGGSVLRCRPGGTDLEAVATGFWNVFGIDQDGAGRWLAADNDPESRGPNRLVHVVPGGDYGYRTLFGREGHHPFLAWDGELPGTLPMVSGTGEAPAGVLSCRRTAFPKAYERSVLVTCWGASRIERHEIVESGVSVAADVSVVVSGGRDFWPVAMAADSRGEVFITDWVSDRYANHGQGRVWRLAPKETGAERMTPASSPVAGPSEEVAAVLREIEATKRAEAAPDLLNLLVHGDPLLTHAAIETLSRPSFWPALVRAMDDTTASIRLGALLALRRAHHPGAFDLVRRFLSDPDDEVRISALRWAVEMRDSALMPALDESIKSWDVSLAVLEAYLAARRALAPEVLETLAEAHGESAFHLSYPAFEEPLDGIIASPSTGDHLRALAMMRLEDTGDRERIEKLARWARERNPLVQRAAVHALSRMTSFPDEILPILKTVSLRRSYDEQVRREAIAAWARMDPSGTEWMLELLDDARASVRLAAARALRLVPTEEPTLSRLEEHYLKTLEDPHEMAVAEQLEFILYGPHDQERKFARERPSDLKQWQERLQIGGDVSGGRRLFHSGSSAESVGEIPDLLRERWTPGPAAPGPQNC